MKCKSLSILSGLLFSICVQAQNNKIEVKSTEDLKETLTTQARYKYPDFSNAIIYFKNRAATAAPLNYNLLLGEMQFVDNTGDTLSVANEMDIKYITIGN